ncbi:16412_t:CDS:1 [Cetraspora pellucida]|uniref:16412_t:CDS:1 n=1 Tax=Cetraspora pellucida TaxID=1433469 RepID=A0ACA9PM86_9GLOM|nr:16412_t:CDS:1 [Cetraspora pellucida]
MGDQALVIHVKNDKTITKLQQALNNGSIVYQSSVSSSSMMSDKHEQVIDNWIKRYGETEKEIRDNLEELKLASDDGHAKNFSYGVVPDEDYEDEECAVVTAFVCWFSGQNENGKRKYSNNNVRVKLNSNCLDDDKKIRKYPLELAAIVLQGKIPNLTIQYDN